MSSRPNQRMQRFSFAGGFRRRPFDVAQDYDGQDKEQAEPLITLSS